MGCAFCHENAGPDGAHAHLEADFLDTLHPGTELAIGGGMVTSHPGLVPFLQRLRGQGLIPNITLHQRELVEKLELVERLIADRLVFGVGVSMQKDCPVCRAFAQTHANCVIHLVNGLADAPLIDALADRGLKILILGYKEFRRGEMYRNAQRQHILDNQRQLRARVRSLKQRFSVVSFDNLALEQLRIRDLVDMEEWEENYMGDDGQHTMYVDLVDQVYAKNSTSNERFPLLPDIRDMFAGMAVCCDGD